MFALPENGIQLLGNCIAYISAMLRYDSVALHASPDDEDAICQYSHCTCHYGQFCNLLTSFSDLYAPLLSLNVIDLLRSVVNVSLRLLYELLLE